jgi:long-chain acyl-CoA synthetase
MLFKALQRYASADRMAIGITHGALQGINIALDYKQLCFEIEKCQTFLAAIKQNFTLAIALENHPAWVVIDLAALKAEIPIVPIPQFFTDAQSQHALTDSGANVLITDNATRFKAIFSDQILAETQIEIAGLAVTQLQLNIATKKLPNNTAKITYTSGTTGAPKGVCLSANAQLQVANSIKTATNLSVKDVHLCVLPLATLLENVAGVYATLLAGGTAHILPSATVGLTGNQLAVQQLISALNQSQASTAIFTPALLSALVLACEAGATEAKSKVLPHLRFLAVGGAHVGSDLVQRAKLQNLPVFEGYGLSECASVVALNTAKHNKIGSVGKPLPHVAISFYEQQEILVKGAQFLAYTNDQETDDKLPEKIDEWLATGDIGYLDDEGYLFLNGRKKNMFITSFGRNISPEWLETALCSQPEITQACVFGEAKPFNIAVVSSNKNALEITVAINNANQNLPDYAQIKHWLMADAPFSVSNRQLTANGRLKRDVIWQTYQAKINALYKD